MSIRLCYFMWFVQLFMINLIPTPHKHITLLQAKLHNSISNKIHTVFVI